VEILYYFIIGFIIGGIGTCVGGLFSVIISKPSDRALSGMLNFAAGIMLSIISFDLVPEAYEIGGFFVVTLGLAIGLLIVFTAEQLIPSHKLTKFKGKKLSYIKMSLIIMISMSLHNFPEGIAIGSSAVYSEKLGLKIGLLIAAHDIPEGMSVGIPLLLAGTSPLSIVLLTLLTGLPTAFGTVFGALLGSISEYFIAFCLSAAASSMLYVSSNELIPEASLLYKGKSNAVFLLMGFICGCYLSFAM
jgi:ZIP family zinc transporter